MAKFKKKVNTKQAAQEIHPRDIVLGIGALLVIIMTILWKVICFLTQIIMAFIFGWMAVNAYDSMTKK